MSIKREVNIFSWVIIVSLVTAYIAPIIGLYFAIYDMHMHLNKTVVLSLVPLYLSALHFYFSRKSYIKKTFDDVRIPINLAISKWRKPFNRLIYFSIFILYVLVFMVMKLKIDHMFFKDVIILLTIGVLQVHFSLSLLRLKSWIGP